MDKRGRKPLCDFDFQDGPPNVYRTLWFKMAHHNREKNLIFFNDILGHGHVLSYDDDDDAASYQHFSDVTGQKVGTGTHGKVTKYCH